MSQKPQNTISQTLIKPYNQFRSIRTEAQRWLQITTNTGKKLKVETEVKEIVQQLLGFITIEINTFEQQTSPEQDVITLAMTPIINISFKKIPCYGNSFITD